MIILTVIVLVSMSIYLCTDSFELKSAFGARQHFRRLWLKDTSSSHNKSVGRSEQEVPSYEHDGTTLSPYRPTTSATIHIVTY